MITSQSESILRSIRASPRTILMFLHPLTSMNSLAPVGCGSNFTNVVFSLKVGLSECHRSTLKLWFRKWLGGARQQGITWANVDQDLCTLFSVFFAMINQSVHRFGMDLTHLNSSITRYFWATNHTDFIKLFIIHIFIWQYWQTIELTWGMILHWTKTRICIGLPYRAASSVCEYKSTSNKMCRLSTPSFPGHSVFYQWSFKSATP